MILKKLIRQMMITQILSAMTVTICMLIDSIMIGRFLGIDSMSAYGYGAPVLLVFTAVSTMISAGSQVLCGRTLGVGDKDGTNSCFSTAIMSALVFSLLGTGVVFIFSNQICTLLGAGINSPDNPVFDLTKNYLFGFLIGAPAFMAQQIMIPYMQMAGGRKKILIAIGVMSISDIVFDLLNVFVFKMGIFGMGLASALSYYIEVIIIIDYFLRNNKTFSFKLSLVKIRTCLNLIKEGTPVLVNQVCLVLLPLIRNNLLTNYGGSVAVAAYSVISSISNVCFASSIGVNSVSLSLSSMFYADKDKKSLRESMKIILKHALMINITMIILVLIFANPIVMIYIKDASAKDLAIVGLRLVIFSFIPCVINGALKNYYQGIGHRKLTMVICAMQNLIMTAISAVILSYFMGVTGIWLSIACGEILTFTFICIYIFIKNKKFSFKFDNFLLLKENLGANDKNCYDASISKQDDVIKVSQNASDFCISKGLEKKTSMYIALAIEEMGNNTIAYGFADGKPHSIDVRIVINEGTTILRIRDNCTSFDPVKYLELHQDDDPLAHIGIRMVMKLVKDAKYENSFGLNNLILEI